MAIRDLPDMYALSPRGCGPRALGIHIRQIPHGHVTTITCTIKHANPIHPSCPIVHCGTGIGFPLHIPMYVPLSMQILPVHPIQLSTVGQVGFPLYIHMYVPLSMQILPIRPIQLSTVGQVGFLLYILVYAFKSYPSIPFKCLLWDRWDKKDTFLYYLIIY